MQQDIWVQSIDDLNVRQVNQLVGILNKDELLNKSLGSQGKKITAEQFKTRNIDWAKNNQAKIFGIMNKSSAIGMISLSHIDLKNKKANIGYWLASKYWGKGITTLVFKQVMAVAKKDKIKYLSCSINKDNKSSIGIWQSFKAKITQKDGKIVPIIKL
jgi:[ribosomal protein S5]-alanine N-acetyltransferase